MQNIIISSVLKTVASENITAEELNKEDKPLEEVLNDKTKETPKQSNRS